MPSHYPPRVGPPRTRSTRAWRKLRVRILERDGHTCVKLELRDHPGDSDREIGRRCGCDGKTVAKVRRELGLERTA